MQHGICTRVHVQRFSLLCENKCIIGTFHCWSLAEDLNESERFRVCAEQGDVRNRIENCFFRTLILKLVNPLESLENRIAINI